jgi:hypothetical protein
MIALEWNIGIDTYTVSPVPSPNLPASIRPGTAIFPWVHLTAFGSPLVPDVKISMSRSSGVAGATSSGACAGRASPSSGSTGTSIAGSSAAYSGSASTYWQSVRMTSLASASPRRTGLSATSTAPANAHPPSRKENSGTLSASTPTWNGRPGARSARSAAAYRAHSLTCSCQLHRRSSNRSPGSGLPARASSSPVTVGSEAGTLMAIRLPMLTSLTGEN